MKQIYLIHGWGGNPNSEVWFDWLRKECKKNNYKLIIPQMPNTNEPKINEWISKIKEVVIPDNNAILIGHSVGCQAILRYIQTLKDEKVTKVILIAPWMQLDENTIKEEGEEVKEIAKPWMETPINFKQVKKHAKDFLCIFSNDDPYVPLTNKEFFENNLNAKTIVKNNEGHFNDTKEIKEILEFIQ